MQGRVKVYFVDRGYGFITGEDRQEYFVSYAQILDSDFRYLERGEAVTFQAMRTAKGLAAHHVKPFDEKEAARIAHALRTPAKSNPFTPQDPVIDPMLFAGRTEHVDLGLDAILNSQNILVTGTRGVGKSSFSTQLLTIASGDYTLLDQLVIPNPEVDLQRLAVAYTCEPGDTLEVIAASIADAVEAYAGSERPTKTTTTLGVTKIIEASHAVEYVETAAPSVAAAFAECLTNAIQAVGGTYDGVTVLIDEIDQLDTTVPLASFLKAAIETLRHRGVGNVSFIITGVTGEITDLLRQHASANRLFMNVHLDPMSDPELKDVVLRALKETPVGVDPRALDKIIEHSACLPASVQLLGYYAYKANSDARIDILDVDEAVAVVIRHIRKQFYRDLRDRLENAYHDAPGLLQSLVDHESATVTLAADSANCRVDEAQFWLDDMVADGAVVQSKDRYYLRDPLFKAFLALGD